MEVGIRKRPVAVRGACSSRWLFPSTSIESPPQSRRSKCRVMLEYWWKSRASLAATVPFQFRRSRSGLMGRAHSKDFYFGCRISHADLSYPLLDSVNLLDDVPHLRPSLVQGIWSEPLFTSHPRLSLNSELNAIVSYLIRTYRKTSHIADNSICLFRVTPPPESLPPRAHLSSGLSDRGSRHRTGSILKQGQIEFGRILRTKHGERPLINQHASHWSVTLPPLRENQPGPATPNPRALPSTPSQHKPFITVAFGLAQNRRFRERQIRAEHQVHSHAFGFAESSSEYSIRGVRVVVLFQIYIIFIF